MYLWIKALHLISVVTWFAALFYLPRLFVYHAMAEDQVSRERFKVMERKLYRGIMTPSMIAVLVLGGWLLYLNPGLMKMGWMHAKLALVFLLIGYHHVCLAFMKKFARDANSKSHVFYRWFNEAPVLILIAVICLAVVKPF
ncbi:MAG: protoporphyrinogen oxidase HemJ [Alcanivoracaceae bacterium]|jgi:putative membrane protein|nr:protoporphyrinogen oxidase HemJ [Alcanivoracaceae bacterium]